MPPSWRFDLRIEEDLIEEVIRLLGYDALPAGAGARHAARRACASEAPARRERAAPRHGRLGWQETINFSFVDERWERDFAGNADADPRRSIRSPAAHSVMRSSLVGSLVEVLRVNLARKRSRVRVFELGKVFVRDATASTGPLGVAGVRQPMRARRARLRPGRAAAVGRARSERSTSSTSRATSKRCSRRPSPRFVSGAASGAASGPQRARSSSTAQRIGVIGELHPRWRQPYEMPAAPIVFELDAEACSARVAELRAVAEAAVGVARHRRDRRRTR